MSGEKAHAGSGIISGSSSCSSSLIGALFFPLPGVSSLSGVSSMILFFVLNADFVFCALLEDAFFSVRTLSAFMLLSRVSESLSLSIA